MIDKKFPNHYFLIQSYGKLLKKFLREDAIHFLFLNKMSPQLEKLICPQCGGNELNTFGQSAYKCESCGTILKDKAEDKKAKSDHYVAPLSTDFTNSIDRNRSVFMNSEERYGESMNEKTDNVDGDTFLKVIIGIGILLIAGLIASYFLT